MPIGAVQSALPAMAIQVSDLAKTYPNGVRAVDGVSFEVHKGEIFGLLGPNGAGKTTILKTIMTLTSPDRGAVTVGGISVKESPTSVRRILGYVPQDVSVDGDLTGFENLLIASKLYFVPRPERGGRIGAALRLMGLEERAGDLVKTYSGGMMRRLEIAQSLVGDPEVLLLDEPSIGLDPGARREVWRHIRSLNKERETTIFLTTHDMVEADELCHRVAIMDHGKFVAEGAPAVLKGSVGGEVITVGLRRQATLEEVQSAVNQAGGISSSAGMASEGTEYTFPVTASAEVAVPSILKSLESAGIEVNSVRVQKPTLDDVFLKFTSVRIEEAEYAQSRRNRRGFRKRSR